MKSMREPITLNPVYRVWQQIHQRCYNPNNANYPQYGGRGIKVAQRWHNFVNFVLDMGERPDRASIERIDNDKGYTPDNCRWATMKEQAVTRSRPRRTKPNKAGATGIRITANGLYQARYGQKTLGTFNTLDEAIKAREEIL